MILLTRIKIIEFFPPDVGLVFPQGDKNIGPKPLVSIPV
jgi:hypothetical protein